MGVVSVWVPQRGCVLCREIPGAGEAGFDKSQEDHPQLSLWPQPGAESHVRGHHRRLEIQQASGFELN